MLALAIALGVLALAAIGALAAVTLRSQLAPAPSLAGKTIVVNTRRPDDQSIRGILVARHADQVTLREVIYIHQSGDQPAAGLVHIPIEAISWMQEIEAISATKES